MQKYVAYMFDEVVHSCQFPEFAQKIQGERVLYDPNACHTYGRNGVELACFKKPVVGSNRVFSYNKLFPELTCDPYDNKKSLELLKMALRDNEKIAKICDRAYKEVEYFNYKNARKRWNEAIDICKDRGGVKFYEKQSY